MALYRVLEAFKPRFRVPVLAMPGTSVPGLPRGQGASEPKEGPDDTESIRTKKLQQDGARAPASLLREANSCSLTVDNVTADPSSSAAMAECKELGPVMNEAIAPSGLSISTTSQTCERRCRC